MEKQFCETRRKPIWKDQKKVSFCKDFYKFIRLKPRTTRISRSINGVIPDARRRSKVLTCSSDTEVAGGVLGGVVARREAGRILSVVEEEPR